jgi:hypothetical protein
MGRQIRNVHKFKFSVVPLRRAYSHWKNSNGFVFSTSDGTNPNTSGRTYWAEIPR